MIFEHQYCTINAMIRSDYVCVCRNLLPAGLYKTTIAWKLRERGEVP